MRTGEKGLQIIKNFEGCRLDAYRCPAGVWTIGYGHTAGVHQGMKITQLQAEELLKNDLKVYENYVNATGLTLNQNQFDALVSFTYNCGPGSLNTLVRKRTLSQIADALLLYNKGGGKVLPGLTRRRNAERELFLKPLQETPAVVTGGSGLPYKVQTTCDLNIRSGAGIIHPKIRVAKKGEILTVWAIETNNDTKWGKNGKEYFALQYCKRI